MSNVDGYESFVVNTTEQICGRWWRAPRIDVPTSVDVNHVCMVAHRHDGPCLCSCGASRG